MPDKVISESVLSHVEYCPESPSFLRRVKSLQNGVQVGEVAGTQNPSGYWQVTIEGRKYQVHRIIWTLLNGQIPENLTIDHIDRNPSNNAIENLRLSSPSDNSCNRDAQSNNSSGVKGLSWRERGKRWRATVIRNGVKSEKYSQNKQVCIDWLEENRPKIHGEFAIPNPYAAKEAAHG